MAHRRRRSFRGSSRGRQQGPSRFAGSKRGARTLEWINLSGLTLPDTINVALPGLHTIGAKEIRSVAILPENIASGGEVTLQRIVGSLAVYQAQNSLAQKQVLVTNMMSMSIQLVQVQHGQIDTASILDSQNASDLDSQNFLWRRDYHAGHVITDVVPAIAFLGADDERGFIDPRVEIDVRSKRRFDRSQWALHLCATVAFVENNVWGISFLFRGLFLTSGGI